MSLPEPKARLVGSRPDELGNYMIVDVMTNDQWMARVYEHEGLLRVFSLKDHEHHSMEDFAHPNLRWFFIEPLTRDEINRHLEVPGYTPAQA